VTFLTIASLLRGMTRPSRRATMLAVGLEVERVAWAEMRRRAPTAANVPAPVGVPLAVVAVIEAGTRAQVTGIGVRDAVVLCLLALATTVPLPLLRPAGAAVAVSSATVLSLALFHTLTVAGLAAAVIALYCLGRLSTRSATALIALPFVVLTLTTSQGSAAWAYMVVLTALAPSAVLAGLAAHARREATEHSAVREAIAGTLVEHAARGERARIARELHDIVAHHISMIAVEAETTRLTTPGIPAAGAERLSAISDTARTALTEMRRLLGVLRDDAGAEPADLEPQPDLRQLNELLDQARDTSSSAARLILHGPPVRLDPAVELAAYRIVQEALTNTRRHAPGAAVDVELHYTDDRIQLRIRDNGPGPPPTAPTHEGHGLLGMRERAAAVGGELHTGAAAAGGFLITASLPGKGEEGS
jgi:signal transduction histidine kinase